MLKISMTSLCVTTFCCCAAKLGVSSAGPTSCSVPAAELGPAGMHAWSWCIWQHCAVKETSEPVALEPEGVAPCRGDSLHCTMECLAPVRLGSACVTHCLGCIVILLWNLCAVVGGVHDSCTKLGVCQDGYCHLSEGPCCGCKGVGLCGVSACVVWVLCVDGLVVSGAGFFVLECPACLLLLTNPMAFVESPSRHIHNAPTTIAV